MFFSFDGFYYSLGIRTEMKQPKRSPFALVLETFNCNYYLFNYCNFYDSSISEKWTI
ncbi:hypothetical protein ONA24_00600 [Mycoplasmopsis cynos]|uniref:hypothetical protein n=1 Tax=Mycoplasmopsis cynos TaxID=171284 RepID=UPI0024CD3385|nr:hypothetical protein [Mycoplasmopsis cynos]WAM04044.1 hypothetical protein ONA22_00680 [Mycoplasmopsis cynos]WAM05226.1 hypothetical protein ONA01_04675 [Mycoplasmopsis cynos]WAM07251.1 hypothetical protein ONA23_06755 [Mycoplasmopsis cynos]WAM08376.1 hypothetical protein ONA21_00225 [Mycoplasmopsis cynos]WAM10337.1 hypothetical protein ONA24_00600 [Mycoplasmopsis cynos]